MARVRKGIPSPATLQKHWKPVATTLNPAGILPKTTGKLTKNTVKLAKNTVKLAKNTVKLTVTAENLAQRTAKPQLCLLCACCPLLVEPEACGGWCLQQGGKPGWAPPGREADLCAAGWAPVGKGHHLLYVTVIAISMSQ